MTTKKKITKKEIEEKEKALEKEIEKKKKELEKNSKTPLTKTYVRIPLIGIIVFALILAAVAFVAGIAFTKFKNKVAAVSTSSNLTTKNIFEVTKTDKPELDFYVMSFCPYGNQMETTLRPIFDLLGDKITLRPRYIFEKVEGDLASYCKSNSPDPTNCAAYVKNSNGQLKDINDCQTQIAAMVKSCNDESKYLKIGNNYYTSLHGRMEANEDVRELCAYNLADNKKNWWDFVGNVNANCTAQNADTCWEEQAKKAGLDTNKITACFNNDATSLIEKEIADTTKYQIQGSPSLMIGDKAFPPTIDSNSTDQNLKIGDKVISLANTRTPDVIKEVICSAFNKAPKECKTVLTDPSANPNAPAASTGGCGSN